MDFAPGSVRQWSCSAAPLEAARLLRVHKYTRADKVRPAIRQAASDSASTAVALARPVASYLGTAIESAGNGRLTLAGGIQLQCPAFDQRLAGCERLLAFVMTLGAKLDARIISLIEERFEPLDALFLETSGWLIIESAVRKLTAQLKAEAAGCGWRLTPCMGPGHDYALKNSDQRAHWPLEEQEKLFQLFQGAPLPVRLLPSCAMQPKISRTGVFGLRRLETCQSENMAT